MRAVYSIIGLRCLIGRNVTIRNSILMGNDFYELPHEMAAGNTPLGVGAGSHIEGAIVDKNCRIGTLSPLHLEKDVEFLRGATPARRRVAQRAAL